MQDVQQVELEDTRRHDLDALRGFAMLLGIALHAALAYLGTGWAVVDSETSPLLGGLVSFVHGFRMPLFFVLSGFFTAMLFQKRGIGGLLRHRTRRILVPLAVCCLTIVPAMWIVVIAAASDNATYGVPESSQNLWTAAAAGDLVQVERFVAFGWPLDDVDPVFRQTPMAWAINHGHHEIVAQLLAAGADPNARYGQEELTSHLHSAAFFGRPECTRLLLGADADPHARNEFGETPLDALRHAKGVVDLVAGILRIEIDFDEVQMGRSEVAALLKSHGAISGLANDAASDGSGSATTARSNSGGTAVRAIVAGLMYFPFFHHLWFLWLLCWLIMGFALVAVALSTVPLRPKLPWWLVASPLALAWVVPLTALTQATMFSGTIVPGFGPDTSAGLLPMPNVLGYYAVFFAFGAVAFFVPGAAKRLGDGWWFLIPSAIVVYPIAIAFSTMAPWGNEIAGNEHTRRMLSAVGQSLFCWLMIFGATGICRRLLFRHRAWVRYLSDSSYWLYIAHLPVVILGQMLLEPLPLPGLIKFTILLVVSTGLLLGSYEWGVRYTFIGKGLNGARTRPSH